jgi:hypothetical protein
MTPEGMDELLANWDVEARGGMKRYVSFQVPPRLVHRADEIVVLLSSTRYLFVRTLLERPCLPLASRLCSTSLPSGT